LAVVTLDQQLDLGDHELDPLAVEARDHGRRRLVVVELRRELLGQRDLGDRLTREHAPCGAAVAGRVAARDAVAGGALHGEHAGEVGVTRGRRAQHRSRRRRGSRLGSLPHCDASCSTIAAETNRPRMPCGSAGSVRVGP
jgi:hypothetical protein